MTSVIMDIGYAIRQIIKRPVYYLMIIMSLAVGMGINTVIYSAYDEAVSKQLPREIKNQDNLVWLRNYHRLRGFGWRVLYREYLEYKENNTVFPISSRYKV